MKEWANSEKVSVGASSKVNAEQVFRVKQPLTCVIEKGRVQGCSGVGCHAWLLRRSLSEAPTTQCSRNTKTQAVSSVLGLLFGLLSWSQGWHGARV